MAVTEGGGVGVRLTTALGVGDRAGVTVALVAVGIGVVVAVTLGVALGVDARPTSKVRVATAVWPAVSVTVTDAVRWPACG
jgi:hypothetical protein